MPDTTKYRALLATVLEEEGLTLHGLTPFAPLGGSSASLPCGLPPPGEALRGSDDPVSLPVPGTGPTQSVPLCLCPRLSRGSRHGAGAYGSTVRTGAPWFFFWSPLSTIRLCRRWRRRPGRGWGLSETTACLSIRSTALMSSSGRSSPISLLTLWGENRKDACIAAGARGPVRETALPLPAETGPTACPPSPKKRGS